MFEVHKITWMFLFYCLKCKLQLSIVKYCLPSGVEKGYALSYDCVIILHFMNLNYSALFDSVFNHTKLPSICTGLSFTPG